MISAVVYYSALYGLSEDFFKTAECESDFRPFVDGPYGEYGPLQFLESTFYENAAIYQIENPNWHDPHQQVKLSALMFRDNKKEPWVCWKNNFQTYANHKEN